MDNQQPTATEAQGNVTVEYSQNPEQRPAQVEGAGSAPAERQGQDKEIDWKAKYFAQKNYTEKLGKRLDELDQWRSELNQRLVPPQPAAAPSQEVDIWTDPKTYVKNEVRQALLTDVRSELEKERLLAQQGKAEEYILSQDYINPESEADKEELQKIFKERGFARIWEENPFLAAEGVLEIYRARKGIGKSTPARAQAGAVLSGSAPAVNGKNKVWTSREIASLTAEEYEKHRSDIEVAVKEGRYKET